MITITKLEKSYGPRTLFEGVALQLNEGARYGLVGANGSGKSTFLKILSGDEEASDGSFRINKGARLGVLRQDRFLDDASIILDLATRGDVVVSNALAEQRRLSQEKQPDAGRIAELEDLIAAHDGYTLEARASEILEGLGIPVASHHLPLSTLSGGFKLRVLLAQVLVGGADLLLLDEPTNHLDIVSIRWLERFLAGYNGCAVVISHDQRFLDNVTTHMLDVDYRTITAYTGNYSRFAVMKAEIRQRKETAITRAEEEIARKRAFVDRFGAKATKATQAQSRLKQIERIEVEELVESSRRSPMIRFEPERPSGREVLNVEGVAKSYGPKQVLKDVSLIIPRGARVGIIGPNGLGKSTLLRILVDRLSADAGTVRWGHEARVGYFPQDHREVLDDDETTPLDVLWAKCPGAETAYVRGQLGRALFSGSDVQKKIRSLSGGEAARLIFAVLAVEKPNVLVLDEPTNHLDLEAIEALIEALKTFEGTVIFVSHDRFFVSELATRIVELTPSGPRDFAGSYAEYLEKCGDDHLDADTVVLKAKKNRPSSSPARSDEGPSDQSREERKRRQNRVGKLPALREKALKDIEIAETRKQAITDMYCQAGFFENTSKEQVASLQAEHAALGPRIEALVAQWEALEKELADLGAG